MPQTQAQRSANRRLGLVLACVALTFGVGFMVKMIFFGR
jgi:hypothetical protein